MRGEGLANEKQASAGSGWVTQTGDYILERVAGPGTGWVRRCQRTRCRAWRSEIDADRYSSSQERSRCDRAATHHRRREAARLPQIEFGNWIDGLFRTRSPALPEVRVQEMRAVR